MYYPYIRGRLYDLLALQMLIKQIKLNDKLIPIIEPVRLSTTLLKTLELFINENHKICVILNPEVGIFNKELESQSEKNVKNSEIFYSLLKNTQIIKTCIIKDDCETKIKEWELKLCIKRKDWFVINRNRNNYQNYLDLFDTNKPKITFIPDGSFYRRKIKSDKVLLEDTFNKQKRNSDYAQNTDEFFSESHEFYKDEKYIGFGDYSIIGYDYSNGGFAPYSVAIHIVYFAKDKTLRVHHFVSDSNNDIKNPAGKFHEANLKLNKWINEGKIGKTIAADEFLRIHKEGSYPGLGTVKKLSLMHHIELMNNFLNKEKS